MVGGDALTGISTWTSLCLQSYNVGEINVPSAFEHEIGWLLGTSALQYMYELNLTIGRLGLVGPVPDRVRFTSRITTLSSQAINTRLGGALYSLCYCTYH